MTNKLALKKFQKKLANSHDHGAKKLMKANIVPDENDPKFLRKFNAYENKMSPDQL